MPSPIVLIANPAAGGGLGGRRLEAAMAAFAPLGATVRLTTAPGDEARLAREAIDAGAGTIAVLGGDGTWGHVVQAVVRAGAPTAVAFLAAGSGNDFVKSLGTPAADFAAMARLVADGRQRTIDTGAIDTGTMGEVPFINSCGFAFDAAVIDRMRRSPMGGRLAYVTASLGILFGYPGVEARVEGTDADFRRYLAVVLANGRHFGGSFVIAPGADLADGALDLVTIAAPMSALTRARTFAAAARGAHVGMPGIATGRGAGFALAFRTPPLFEADGELYQAPARELVVRCRAGSLRVVA